MKNPKNLEKVAFNFALELLKMRNLFPAEERSSLAFEIVKEAVSVCTCLSTATGLDIEDAKDEFIPTAYSATFRIQVMLEISRDLNYLKTIDKQMYTLKKIRTGLKEIMNKRMHENP